MALGADGSIYLTGSTESLDFPATAGTVQPAPRGGSDIFLAHIGIGGTKPGPVPGGQHVYLPMVLR